MFRRMLFILCVSAVVNVDGATSQIAGHFDSARRVTLKGSLAGLFIAQESVSYLVIDTKNSNGEVEHWALEGNDAGTLVADGWKPRMLPLGDAIEATAFPLVSGMKAADIVRSGAPDAVQAAAKAGHLAHGIDVKFSSGRTLTFGNSK